jgi:hypothetical protein
MIAANPGNLWETQTHAQHIHANADLCVLPDMQFLVSVVRNVIIITMITARMPSTPDRHVHHDIDLLVSKSVA